MGVQVAETRKREQQGEKLMYEIAQENKRMSEPLRKARQARVGASRAGDAAPWKNRMQQAAGGLGEA